MIQRQVSASKDAAAAEQPIALPYHCGHLLRHYLIFTF